MPQKHKNTIRQRSTELSPKSGGHQKQIAYNKYFVGFSVLVHCAKGINFVEGYAVPLEVAKYIFTRLT